MLTDSDLKNLEKSLTVLSESEWEDLCDRCGICCLEKLEDRENNRIWLTRVPCRLLDPETGLCRDYVKRQQIVPDCLKVDPYRPETRRLLPVTCAYRLRLEGKPLPPWHPLLTGEPESTRKSGNSVLSLAVRWHPGIQPEDYILEEIIEDHVP